MDIKLNAEKQLGNRVTNAVFTVPTNFSLRQRNAFKDVAKMAGLESVHILSEMSSIAIGYKFHEKQVNDENLKRVLIIIINEFECEAGICCADDKKIQFQTYNYQNLNSDGDVSVRHKIDNHFPFN